MPGQAQAELSVVQGGLPLFVLLCFALKATPPLCHRTQIPEMLAVPFRPNLSQTGNFLAVRGPQACAHQET